MIGEHFRPNEVGTLMIVSFCTAFSLHSKLIGAILGKRTTQSISKQFILLHAAVQKLIDLKIKGWSNRPSSRRWLGVRTGLLRDSGNLRAQQKPDNVLNNSLSSLHRGAMYLDRQLCILLPFHITGIGGNRKNLPFPHPHTPICDTLGTSCSAHIGRGFRNSSLFPRPHMPIIGVM